MKRLYFDPVLILVGVPMWLCSSALWKTQNGVDWPSTNVVRGGAALYGGDRRLPRRKLMEEVMSDRYFPRWLPRGRAFARPGVRVFGIFKRAHSWSQQPPRIKWTDCAFPRLRRCSRAFRPSCGQVLSTVLSILAD